MAKVELSMPQQNWFKNDNLYSKLMNNECVSWKLDIRLTLISKFQNFELPQLDNKLI